MSTDPTTGDPAADGAATVALVEPARRRVVQIAADVLGRLKPEETPVALRPFARFTPARRRQRGAVQIAAVLDTDEGFRAKVSDAVADTLPELVAAIGSGEVPAASDPVDVAVVAYLVRPDGWQDVLGAATERWRAQRAHAERVGAERARLQSELADVRARLKHEAARTRAAVDEAEAASRERIGELERALRERTGTLRERERELHAVRGEVLALKRAAEASEAAHETQLRRLRDRVAELERSAGAARREARVDRDLDDARLWLLVETINAAAAGVRRELSLPPPALRPADAVAATSEGAAELALAAGSVADAQGLDRLLAMPEAHLIVDGYNVTMSGYGELALADQRERLIGSLAPLGARSGAEVTVVFDGGTRPSLQPRTPRGVRVLFSAADAIADDLIRALVAAEPPGRTLIVVTSDQQLVTDVRLAGAWTVPSAVLLARLG